ncbi:MAG TPA: hypothetical protein VJ946_08070 [Bacteroidales bacterium]|nr:hypothetical protein [Bacteroidales bacterium]
MTDSIKLLGILVREPEVDTHYLQDTLTSYGCNIRTRLGINGSETEKNALILLELTGSETEQKNLQDRLQSIRGLEIQSMTF